MPPSLREKISGINARIGALLDEARQSLHGQKSFGVEQVRALSAPISEMAPIMARAKELRTLDPVAACEIDRYKSQLGELHVTLQHVHMMLLARRAQMESGRAQLEAVSQWANTLGYTR
jgi:hypothetical protein